jgi:cyclophilin family peptidyl-prolyl cis-trans isomerase
MPHPFLPWGFLFSIAFALVSCGQAGARAPAEPDPEPPARKVLCAIKTNHGTIKIELFPDKAPATVKNFLGYVNKKHYDGLVFHRVIASFMIQGGGYKKGVAAAQNDAGMRALEKPTGKPIRCESANGVSNRRGTLAMARAANPDSATAQFFINVKDNVFLDRANAADKVGYCVFGKVVAGMEVVEKIKKVQTKAVGNFRDVPAADVVIESIRRVPR